MVLYGLDRPLSGVTRAALELGRAMQTVDLCDLTFLTPSRVASLSGTNAAFWRLLGCRRLPALMLLGGPLIAQNRVYDAGDTQVYHEVQQTPYRP